MALVSTDSLPVVCAFLKHRKKGNVYLRGKHFLGSSYLKSFVLQLGLRKTRIIYIANNRDLIYSRELLGFLVQRRLLYRAISEQQLKKRISKGIYTWWIDLDSSSFRYAVVDSTDKLIEVEIYKFTSPS